MELMDIVFIPWVVITTITIPILMRNVSQLNAQQKELKREVDICTKTNSILHARQTELHLKWEKHAATLRDLATAANRPDLFDIV